MNGGTAATIDDSLYSNWLPSGVWQGLFSGGYTGGLNSQGGNGGYLSSTANATVNVYSLYFSGGYVFPASNGDKDFGYAVRCLI